MPTPFQVSFAINIDNCAVKDVHKVPLLDLVGWYTTLPTSGPQPCNLPIHRQILQSYNESAIFLGFHPTEVLDGSVGGKLPLTIYESNFEADDGPAKTGEDEEMRDVESKLALKFKELPYTIETGEAEFISVDFVARGGGNATAVDGTVKKPAAATSTATEVSPTADKGKGKGKGKKAEEPEKETKIDEQQTLSREDEEQIASLTAKANAIKMLHARINLIATYLQNLPPSYISDGKDVEGKEYTPTNHAVLRSVQALLSRLALLIPADSTGFEHELVSEQNDVSLIGMLNTITQSVKEVRELGKKYAVIEVAKNQKMKGQDRSGSWDTHTEGKNNVHGVGDLLG